MTETWKPIATAPLTTKHKQIFSPWLIVGHAQEGWVRVGHFYPACNRWYYSGNYGHGDIPTHWWSLLPSIRGLNTLGEQNDNKQDVDID